MVQPYRIRKGPGDYPIKEKARPLLILLFISVFEQKTVKIQFFIQKLIIRYIVRSNTTVLVGF